MITRVKTGSDLKNKSGEHLKTPYGTYITNFYEFNFSSIKDMAEYTKNTPVHSKSKLSSQRIEKNEQGFAGTKTYEDAENLFINGWQVGAEKINNIIHTTMKKEDKEVKKIKYDVAGFQASVPRFLNGIPTNMIRQTTAKKPQSPILNLYLNVSWSCGFTVEQIQKFTAKFLKLVIILEASGFRINLYAVSCSYFDQNAYSTILKLKDAAERLNILKCAFTLAHPSYQRRIIFKVQEVTNVLPQSFYDHYGYCFQKYEIKDVYHKPENNCYYIPNNFKDEVENITFEQIKKC